MDAQKKHDTEGSNSGPLAREQQPEHAGNDARDQQRPGA